MIPTLRPYQDRLAQEVRQAYIEKVRSVLVVAPTGSGKTTLFSYIAANASQKGNRTWIVAHRKELINQASGTLGNFEVNHGIIKSGVKSEPWHLVQAASIQSLGSRIGKLAPPDLIVADEGHHCTSAMWAKVFAAYPNAKILIVTATPKRLDGRGLGCVADRMILGPSVKELTEAGYLSPVRYFAPASQVDRSQIPKERGDFTVRGMEEAMNRKVIIGDAIENYQKICDGQPLLSFCVSVQHAKDVAAAYLAAGYRATYVDGTLSDDDRADRINGLGTGKYQVLSSCELIGEGLDVPVVVGAQFLRPTESLNIFLQQLGRTLRPIYAPGYPLTTDEERILAIANGPKPFAFAIDHVGNIAEHQFADTHREWTLESPKRKKLTDEEKDVIIRTCVECFSVHPPATECPYCGFIYPVKSRKLEVTKGELMEIQAAERMAKKQEQGKAQSLGELIAIGVSRGYKNPQFWARQIFNARMAGGRRLYT